MQNACRTATSAGARVVLNRPRTERSNLIPSKLYMAALTCDLDSIRAES